MKYRAYLFVPFAICTAAAVVIACSSDPDETPGSGTPDAGGDTRITPSPSDATTETETSVATDSGPTGTCPVFKGAVPQDAGAQCHDLASSTISVTAISDPGPEPVGTGGTLGDGLYYLTEARLYPGSPVPAGTKLKYAVLVVGDYSYVTDDNGATVRRTTKRNPDGTDTILCETKTDNNPKASTQTATCDSLNSFDTNSKFSTKFVKQ